MVHRRQVVQDGAADAALEAAQPDARLRWPGIADSRPYSASRPGASSVVLVRALAAGAQFMRGGSVHFLYS